jgi:hypothetical protein
MAAPVRIFISHTTGDRRDLRLAHRLADALQTRGAQVWIAPESIPAGAAWEREIVAGILERCTHFLAILSSASTGAEWVLKEIDLARRRQGQDRGFTVLPLVVGRLGGYPASDYIERLQQVPYRDDFAAQLEEVVAAVGLRPQPPTAWRSFIAEKTDGFVGRDHVLAAIERFLRSRRCGYFVVVGDPGAGKSALLAEYVRRTGCVAHFNVRSQGITQASQFVESVGSQVIARYGLAHPSLPPAAGRDGSFLAGVLEEAAPRDQQTQRLVIAVDALDEVDLASQTPGSNVLYLPATLPEGVFFVMTRRQQPLPLTVQAPYEVFDLLDYPEQNLRDATRYIRAAAGRQRVRSWIESHRLSVDDFVQRLAERSETNFMYLRHVLPEIERGIYRDLTIEQLPVGLEGYYEDHWRRMGMAARPLPRTKIKVVYLLAEIRQPATRRLLAEFAGEDELSVQEVLDEWDPFLREQRSDADTLFSLYHTSFRDFLHRKDVVRAAGVNLRDINAAIADDLYERLFGDA